MRTAELRRRKDGFTMDFMKNMRSVLKSAGGAMQSAVVTVTEKNRQAALANRLRTLIRCEEKAAERAYLALGRYYYHNLRDAENSITEPHCIDVEASERRIDEAVQKLEALCREEPNEDIEEVTLADVRELTQPQEADEPAPPEGLVDEAVEAAEPAAAYPEAEKDASADLPFEG